MKTIAWLVAGFALLGLTQYLENMGIANAAAGGPLAVNLPATVAMLGASTCFFSALRSALARIVGRGSPKPPKTAPSPTAPRLASRIFAAPAQPDFDADAAFARYMQQREADNVDAVQESPEPMQAPPPQPAFGRRVL